MPPALLAGAAALAMASAPPALAQGREASLYLRCDGKPNNVTDGENFARLVGAITLLGLFAPAPENPDPSKRLFGQAGIDACSQLIEPGERAEGNVVRRIPLILARAAHRIEIGDHAGAIADAEIARAEAVAAGLVGNPYFDRSMGLNFDKIIGRALMVRGDYTAARDVYLRGAQGHEFRTYAMALMTNPEVFLDDIAPEERRQRASLARQTPGWAMSYALRLDDIGDHAEAAALRRDMLELLELAVPKTVQPTHYARTALSEALAGQWEQSDAHLARARAIIAERAAAGTPVSDLASATEQFDLNSALRMMRDGDLAGARRIFAGRSQWLDASFGVTSRLIGQLREGAGEEELIGSLAKSPEELRSERHAARRAVLDAQTRDNSTLFIMLGGYADIEAYERMSSNVWRTDRSRMMQETDMEGTGFYEISSTTPDAVRNEALLLHAALQARAQGKEGFLMMAFDPLGDGRGIARFMDRSELNPGNRLFIDAATVIAELSPIIPSPDALRTRRQERRRSDRERESN